MTETQLKAIEKQFRLRRERLCRTAQSGVCNWQLAIKAKKAVNHSARGRQGRHEGKRERLEKKDFAFTELDDMREVKYLIDPVKSVGIEKLARLYIKCLLTMAGSNLDDEGYGTLLLDIPGSTTDKEGRIARSKAAEAVTTANNWFKRMQRANPTDPEETLDTAKIADMEYDVQTGKFTLRLFLLNVKKRSVAFGLTI